MGREREQAEGAKARGNELFAKGKYAAAVDAYTEAILFDPKWDVPLVNRALCRRRLKAWPAVKDDCEAALRINADNVKAHYYLGLALMQSGNVADAVRSLQKSLELARESGATIQDEVWRELARAKHCAWLPGKERRDADRAALLERLEAAAGGGGASAEDIEGLRGLAEAAAARDAPGEPPDEFTCRLTFDVFRDPVVCPSGQSFERSALQEHLHKVGKFDPVTRDPLRPEQLVRNHGLRAAAHAWLDEHPWAYADIAAGRPEIE